MKVHRIVAEALADCDVTALFGLMGDANMYTVGDYIRNGRGRYYQTVTEGGACSMAQGYARVSGKVGVATVTHGPGVANTINAVTEASRARTPFVLVTGTTPSRPYHQQQIDLNALFAATGAEYHRVLRPIDVANDVAKALARAAAMRKAVILDVPGDLLFADIDYHPPTRVPPIAAPSPDPDALDQALGRIASAARPLIVAGRGALESGAADELVRLADLLGAPLATTASAKDLFHGHPYNLGIMGSTTMPWALDVMTASDCVIAFGAAMGYWTTYGGSIMDGRALIHCDTDPAAIGVQQPADLAVIGDATATACLMADQLEAAGHTPSDFRATQLGAGDAHADPRSTFDDTSADGMLDMRTAMIVLDEHLPARRCVTTDGGRFVPIPWRYLHVDEPRAFVHTYGWGSIGLGTATGIGAAIARPDALSVCIAGDGGGMMGIIEFSSAVRYGIPYLMVILNDAAYGAEYDKFAANGFDASMCFNSWPDFVDLAHGLGGRGVVARSEAELVAILQTPGAFDGQLLIDVRCNPHVNAAD